MLNIDSSKKRIGFIILMLGILAYLLYIIISYYTTDHVGMVRLSYDTDENNIVSAAYATYTMKVDEGSLMLSQDRDIELTEPDGTLSVPIILSTTGKIVSEIELELIYDDTKLMYDENKLMLVKYDKKTSKASRCDYSLDTEKNSIIADVSGDGIWFVTTPEAVK